ncbi:hypothetical protein BDR07DRAFT_1414079 [Suillus spraguei]|nr:hypothetical protein BDR07DRAFT_1414079 [Suillus spraguei]
MASSCFHMHVRSIVIILHVVRSLPALGLVDCILDELTSADASAISGADLWTIAQSIRSDLQCTSQQDQHHLYVNVV